MGTSEIELLSRVPPEVPQSVGVTGPAMAHGRQTRAKITKKAIVLVTVALCVLWVSNSHPRHLPQDNSFEPRCAHRKIRLFIYTLLANSNYIDSNTLLSPRPPSTKYI